MTSVVAESVALRRWALRLLSSPDSAPQIPECARSSWQHCLSVERCGLPLKSRLLQTDSYGQLTPDALAVVDATAAIELQRILSARGHLLLIDRLAAEHGWEVIVLKGGVAAWKDEGAVDLEDLDVLARPQDARALSLALDSAGYKAAGASSPLHLKGRSAEGGVKIEVHAKIDMVGSKWSESLWSQARPLDGAECLKRLGPRDHLWHHLVHVGVLHPYRRGAIRDLLLLSQAMLQCAEHDLAEVHAAVARHPYAGTLRAMLSTASGFTGATQLEDRVARQAAIAHFVARYGRLLPLPELLRSDVGTWAVAFLSGGAVIKREWGRIHMVTSGTSISPMIAWLERGAPRLGRGVRVGSRVVRATAAAVLAVPLALGAAWTARRVSRDRP